MITLTLLRHAPPITGGRLAGRTDVEADCTDLPALRWLAARLDPQTPTLVSPARRCRQTAAAIGRQAHALPPALWEQDYGAWEGLPYDRLPDLGPLDTAALARHRPPGGESFDDMTARVCPVLRALTHSTVIVAHAGTARAALSMVVGSAALSFQIAPLSLTILHRAGDGPSDPWAVGAVNVTAP